MGCEPSGPPFANWEDRIRHAICEAYKALGGDCCDLDLDGDGEVDVSHAAIQVLDTRYDTHKAAGGFGSLEEEGEFLELMNDLEGALDSPASSLSQEAEAVARALVEKARNDLQPT